jgi:hypothetical protein
MHKVLDPETSLSECVLTYRGCEGALVGGRPLEVCEVPEAGFVELHVLL